MRKRGENSLSSCYGLESSFIFTVTKIYINFFWDMQKKEDQPLHAEAAMTESVSFL